MKTKSTLRVLLFLTLSAICSLQLAAQTCRSFFTHSVAGNTVQFTSHYVGSSTPVSVAWDFGNGATAAIGNTTYRYSASGTYNVCLTITDVSGCQGVFCDSVTIGDLQSCNAAFTSTNNQNYYTFHNSSSGNNLSFVWHFGDGVTSTNVSPSHVY